MAKKSTNSGINEWQALKDKHLLTGVPLNDVKRFLKKFPRNQEAFEYRKNVLAEIDYDKKRFASIQQTSANNSNSNVNSSSVGSLPSNEKPTTVSEPIVLSEELTQHTSNPTSTYTEPTANTTIESVPKSATMHYASPEALGIRSIIENHTVPTAQEVLQQKFPHLTPEHMKFIDSEKTYSDGSDGFGPDSFNRKQLNRDIRNNILKQVNSNFDKAKQARIASGTERTTKSEARPHNLTANGTEYTGNITGPGKLPTVREKEDAAKLQKQWNSLRNVTSGSVLSTEELRQSQRLSTNLSTEELEAITSDKYHNNPEPFKSYTGDLAAESKSLQEQPIDSTTMRANRLTDVQESKQGSNYIRPYSSKIGNGTKLRVDRADELYAAYNGMNTTVEDTARIAAYRPASFSFSKEGAKSDLHFASVVTSGQPLAPIKKAISYSPLNTLHTADGMSLADPTSTDPRIQRHGNNDTGRWSYSEAFKETDDSISKINPLLRGISTLNDGDASTMKQMHNQDLVNKRAGNRAGYVGLKDSDIYLEGNKKSFAPWQMTNKRSLTHGYGMGWGNAWRADRSTHAMRAISTINPFSRGNASIGMEALGRISTRDRLLLNANPTVMNRLTTMAIPLTAAATLGFGMYDNQSVGELATNMLLPAVALPGARAGLSVGAMLTPAKTSSNLGILRGLGMGIGATTGVALAATAVIGASALATDITSNESSIRKMAKKFTTKEIYTQSEDSRQSLTARQMALNKLSKSGLNDRALLLGNEAAGLAGLI